MLPDFTTPDWINTFDKKKIITITSGGHKFEITGKPGQVAINGFEIRTNQWVEALNGKQVFLKSLKGEQVVLQSSGSDGNMTLDGKEIFGKEYETTFDYVDTYPKVILG